MCIKWFLFLFSCLPAYEGVYSFNHKHLHASELLVRFVNEDIL